MKKCILFLWVFAIWSLGFCGFVGAVNHYEDYDANLPRLSQGNGSIKIQIWKDGTWEFQGSLTFDKYFREKQIQLNQEVNNDNRIRVKLVKDGGRNAHIDAVFLGGRPASGFSGPERSVDLAKLASRDFDVLHGFEKSLELVFDNPGPSLMLTITARIEPERIGKIPFQLPLVNLYKKMGPEARFWSYDLGSNPGSLGNDPDFNAVFSGKPFFKEFLRAGSGHPSENAYGWVMNDEANLYVVMDITGDNTMDGEEDYTKVYVNTPGGLKTFKVTQSDNRWGEPYFMYTDKATWQHKVYAFRIPFEEIGINDPGKSETLQLAFAAYGTLSAPDIVFSKAFNPDIIGPGSVSTLTFTISNNEVAPAESVAFTDNLPANVLIAPTPNTQTTCTGGVLTAVAGSGVISYTGGTVPAGGSCTIEVDVTGNTAGSFVNTSGDLTSSFGNSGAASDTLTVTSPPTVTTNAATGIGSAGATVNGTVNANGESTVVYFEYGTSVEYGSTMPAPESPVTGIDSISVTAALILLDPLTDYHYRAVATNASGTTYGSDMTFSTTASSGSPPFVITDAANGIGADFATLNGRVLVYSLSTAVSFEWGTDTGYGNTITTDQSPASSGTLDPVTATITGLANNTTYHYRVVASNPNGTTYGTDMTFVIGTGGTAPTATTTAATGVGSTSATLNGTVNANGAVTAVSFEYGLDTNYGNTASATPGLVSGNTDTSVTAALSELPPNTTFHYRVVGTNAMGTTNGSDMTFTTLPPAPAVSTNAASPVGTTTATLNGTVNANTNSTTVTFEYGVDTNYGTTVTATQSPVTGSSNTAVSKGITGLVNGVTYHYRVVATNAGGTTYGADMTFITGTVAPTATSDAATGVGTTTATLNGTINANNSSATVSFQYGHSPSYDRTIDAIPGTVTGSSNTAVNAPVSMLSPNMTYHYRVAATNAGGITYGQDMIFTTGSGPQVTTETASVVGITNATLNGTVNANNDSTTVTFEYGLDAGYGTSVAALQSPMTGATDSSVSLPLTLLQPGTTYHYRVVGQNSSGTTYGADMTFTTGLADPDVPTAVTTAASGQGTTTANLNGTVDSKGHSTIVTFEYGVDTNYGTTVTADQSPVILGGDTGVSSSLNGLTASTTYHYRVVAQNAFGTAYGNDMTFYTSVPAAPTATTNAATAAGTDGATLNGTVNANNSYTLVYFDYGSTTDYGNTMLADQSPVTGISSTPVTLNVTGLTNNTTYHYRVRILSSFGVLNGADMTFTTTSPPPAPTATTDAASAVGSNTATVNGTVNSNGGSTTVTFEYGLDTGYGKTTTAGQSPVTGSIDTAVSSSLASLAPNTTYHYRVVAQKGADTVYGADMTFTTGALSPSADTNAATAVIGTGATLHGTVNANNDSTTVTFEYGTDTNYGTMVTATQSPVTGNSNTAISKAIINLTTNTLYHYRVVAQNSSGTTYGADMTFSTATAPPAATTGAADNISTTGATLHGTVNANNGSTAVTFEYGETTDYGRTATADQSPVTGDTDTPVSVDLGPLNPNTTYHYRVVGQNSAGTTNGADMTFTTVPIPTVSTNAASAVGSLGATLNGTVNANGGTANVSFEYGTDTAYGSTINATQSPVIGSADTPVSADLTGLIPGATYYYRAVGQNPNVTINGANMTFFTDPLPPTFGKVFNPDTFTTGGVSTLTFTIDNTVNALGASSLDFTDNLPANVLIAPTPNAQTTCTGGTLTAATGTGVVSYTGGSVPAGGSCTVQVDVTSSVADTYNNTSGDLTSSSGNSGSASDTLTVTLPAAPVTFIKVFSPDTIGPGSVSTLTFTITNPSPDPAEQLAFSDTLPAGVTISDPANATSSCGGTLSAPAGGGTISLSDGLVGGNSSCTISVDVTSTTAGVHTNTTGDLTSTLGTSGTATDDLTVSVTLPGFSKSFAPGSVPLGGRSTLTFTIENTGNAANVLNLDFTDNLPNGLVIADPANAATTCGTPTIPATLTAVAGSSLVTLDANGTGSFPAVAAGATCTVTVDVTAEGSGMLDNITGELLADFTPAGKASATLEVTVTPIALGKSFTDDPVPPGGTVNLEFTVYNLDRNHSAINIVFTDDLTTALAGLTFSSLLSNNCGGTITGVGTTGISLTGGTLGPESSCTFNVTLQVPAATPGTYTNTTGAITADIDGSPVTGNAASDPLFVSPIPLLTKEFLEDGTLDPDPVVNAGDDVVLRFTVTNTSATDTATAITFIDELTDAGGSGESAQGFLPFPVSVTLPPVPDPPCGAGSSLALVSVGTDRQGLELTGGSLDPGDSCTFEVTLMVPSNFSPGTYTNTTREITATVDGGTRTGSPASDDLTVIGAPQLTKAFTDDPVAPDETVTLEFTLTHHPDATGDATDISFTDDLNAALAGLTATLPPTPDPPCGPGSTLTGSAGDTFLTMAGGTLMPGEDCTFSVTLTVPPGAAAGSYTNTTSDVDAMVGGLSATSSPATDDLKVADLRFTKEFIGDPVIAGDTTTLRFTIENLNQVSSATNMSFSDSLSGALAGLTVSGTLPTTPCGPGSAITGTTSLAFTGGELAPGASCTFDVALDVPGGAADGTYLNVTSSLTATVGVPVSIEPATDELTVNSTLLQLAKDFTDDPVAAGGTANLSFTLTNLDAGQAASDIAFSDDLDAALSGLVATGLPISACGGTVSTPDGGSTIEFSGGSLGAGASCQFDVSVTVPVGAADNTYTNTTSGVTGTINGLAVTGDASSDDLVVSEFLQFSKSFDGPTTANGTPMLTFTITNPRSSAVSGLSFSDNLDNVISGLVATNLPMSDICGPGSQLSGTSFLTLTGANLAPNGGTCSFDVELLVPGMVTAGTFPNTTSDLFQQGLKAAHPATDTLTIEPPPTPTFSKVFTPDTFLTGGVSTLSFTIDNTASVLEASGLDFTDNLPANVLIAPTPNATATCTGGTLTAAAGAGVISYTGGTVPAGGSCTVEVDVTGNVAGLYVNTSGDLTSSSGNSGTASDTLTVTAIPITVSIDDVSVTEGDAGTVGAGFTVTLSQASANTVTVDYATADNTATTADGDYTAVSTTALTFIPGETFKMVTVLVNGDTIVEDNETFYVNLYNATNADIFDNQGVGTIIDDDDLCPDDPNKTEPGECGCGVRDLDSDNDGTLDCDDGCPCDPEKTEPGNWGCLEASTDSDSDGTPDCGDACPDDPEKIDPGVCGCGESDIDSDGDGTPDCDDPDGQGSGALPGILQLLLDD